MKLNAKLPQALEIAWEAFADGLRPFYRAPHGARQRAKRHDDAMIVVSVKGLAWRVQGAGVHDDDIVIAADGYGDAELLQFLRHCLPTVAFFYGETLAIGECCAVVCGCNCHKHRAQVGTMRKADDGCGFRQGGKKACIDAIALKAVFAQSAYAHICSHAGKAVSVCRRACRTRGKSGACMSVPRACGIVSQVIERLQESRVGVVSLNMDGDVFLALAAAHANGGVFFPACLHSETRKRLDGHIDVGAAFHRRQQLNGAVAIKKRQGE